MALLSLALGSGGDGGDLRGVSRFIAWPAGTAPFFIAGSAVWVLGLIPHGRIEGRWTRRSMVGGLSATVAGAVIQLLDDHVFNHPGIENPLGFSIPYPFQDLLTFAALVMMGAALLGVLVTMPGKIRSAVRSRPAH